MLHSVKLQGKTIDRRELQMSLIPPFPEIGTPSREVEIGTAVNKRRIRMGIAMLIECGGVKEFGVALEEQKETARANFHHAIKLGLRDAGVLDENFDVISGQEEFAKNYGF